MLYNKQQLHLHGWTSMPFAPPLHLSLSLQTVSRKTGTQCESESLHSVTVRTHEFSQKVTLHQNQLTSSVFILKKPCKIEGYTFRRPVFCVLVSRNEILFVVKGVGRFLQLFTNGICWSFGSLMDFQTASQCLNCYLLINTVPQSILSNTNVVPE